MEDIHVEEAKYHAHKTTIPFPKNLIQNVFSSTFFSLEDDCFFCLVDNLTRCSSSNWKPPCDEYLREVLQRWQVAIGNHGDGIWVQRLQVFNYLLGSCQWDSSVHKIIYGVGTLGIVVEIAISFKSNQNFLFESIR